MVLAVGQVKFFTKNNLKLIEPFGGVLQVRGLVDTRH
jgi:hypothetical protein